MMESNNTWVLGKCYPCKCNAGIFNILYYDIIFVFYIYNIYIVYFLGCGDMKTRKLRMHQQISSLMRLTYRKEFPALEPYAYTDDAGWGCMLRSAQMLMAHTLCRHHLGNSKFCL